MKQTGAVNIFLLAVSQLSTSVLKYKCVFHQYFENHFLCPHHQLLEEDNTKLQIEHNLYSVIILFYDALKQTLVKKNVPPIYSS